MVDSLTCGWLFFGWNELSPLSTKTANPFGGWVGSLNVPNCAPVALTRRLALVISILICGSLALAAAVAAAGGGGGLAPCAVECQKSLAGYGASALSDVFVPGLHVRSVRVIVDVVERPDQLAQCELVVEGARLQCGAGE